MARETGGATEVDVKPGDSSKAKAGELTGKDAKDALTNGSIVALTAAVQALNSDALEVEPEDTREAQFYAKAIEYAEAAIREVTWALEENAGEALPEG